MTDYQERLAPTGSLRLIFLSMALWDFLGGGIQLAFHSFLFDITKQAEMSGVLTGRAFSGALFVTGILYLIGARDPVRYRFILWLAVIEQLIAVCTGIFHGARSDIRWSDLVLPIGVAMLFLVLVLRNFPHTERVQWEEPGGEAPDSGRERAPDEE